MGTRPIHPDTLRSMLRDHDQRITALARTPAIGNTVIRTGALIVANAAGAAQIVIGEYTWPTTGQVITAIVVLDASGHPAAVIGQQPAGVTPAYGSSVAPYP